MSPVLLPATSAVVSRRAALGGATAGLAALSGCDLDEPAPRPSPAPRPTAADPDQELAERAAREVAVTLALVTAAAGRSRDLARRLGGLVEMHEAHLEVLGSPDGDEPPPAVGGRAPQVLEQVLRRERLAQRRLADWSVTAGSGQLARLLASMSAAIAQQLAATGQRTGPAA